MTTGSAEYPNVDVQELRTRAQWIRLETLRLVAIARSGHYSSTFSCAELLAVLYYHHLRLDPTQPHWPDRDRFVMSKGHAAVGLYPVLADLGFYPVSSLDDYTRVGSEFADHPKLTIPGCDFGSGSLGHGLSVSAGMALAGRRSGRDFRVHCMLGDGELNEGQIWEAAMAASHFRLGNLVAIVDRNGMGLDGFTEEVMAVEPIRGKFESFGWRVVDVDGHDVEALVRVFDELPSRHGDVPTAIVAATIKGKGVSWMEYSRTWHLGALVGPDLEAARAEIQGEGIR
jgi:transketolase